MSEIILYSGEKFSSAHETIRNDTSDYKSVTSLNQVESLIVTGGTWIVFSAANYKGDFAVYKEGEYRFALKINKIGSLRKLSGSLEKPDFTAFEQIGYQGLKTEFTGNEYPTVTSSILSHQVVNGVWTLYDGPGYTGNSIVTISGEQVPNETELGLKGPVKSLKAYLTYETRN